MKTLMLVSLVLSVILSGCYTIIAEDFIVHQEVTDQPEVPEYFPPLPPLVPPPPPPQHVIIYSPTPAPEPANTIRTSGQIRTGEHRDTSGETKRSNSERGGRGQ